MPNLSIKNAQVINEFIANYKQLNALGKKLFPQAIKELLEQHATATDPAENAFELISLLMRTTKLLKLSCITKFKESSLYINCKLLNANGLFSKENALVLLSHPVANRLFAAIHKLNEHNLLHGNEGQEHFNAVAHHLTAPDKAAHALITLHKSALLNAKNREAVTQHLTHPEAVAALLQRISPWGLLTGEQGEKNLQQVINHPHPDTILLAVELLNPCDGDLQDKFEVIMNSKASYAAALSLLELEQENMPISAIKTSLTDAEKPGFVTTLLINNKRSLQSSAPMPSSSTNTNENAHPAPGRM
ncbi:hypothetical protein [Legionella saoudiensis]|uniref:hypothetical protein n=1 Tax=Legionella saoudiensis TaxID=1750561 RepID=UPI00072FBA66|nr:hypothetical protein [Legionella saoudiensis]